MEWNIGTYIHPLSRTNDHYDCDMDYYWQENDNAEKILVSCKCKENKRMWNEASLVYPNMDPFAALHKYTNNITKNSIKYLRKILDEK